jgi:TRAP-type C4-dicarboxylate transport system substrate-binding protein
MKYRNLVTALAVVAGLASAAAVEARELIYGAWVSPKHPVMSIAMPYLFRGVEKDTNGTIKWKMVAGGQLVNGKGTLPGIRDGLIDAGMSIPAYTPKHLPATNSVFSSLVFGNDIVAAGGASTEVVMLECPECLAEIKKNKAVFLGGYSPTPFMVMCRDKVPDLAGLKGKKIRTSGGGTYLMKMAGATPVSMSPAAATTALQRGTIDCVLGAPSWLKSYGYQDVAKHIINYPLGMPGPILNILLSRKTWNGMTRDQKKAHLKYAPRVVAEAVITAYMLRDAKILKNAKASGVTLYDVGPEFDQLVEKRLKIQRGQNITNARRFGVKNPEAIADAFEKILKKWKRLSKDIGSDVGKYEAALQREIYDKIDVDKL